MERTCSLIHFIETYYLDSNIPLYLFSDEKCIFCMPEQNELTYPPFQYLQELFSGFTEDEQNQFFAFNQRIINNTKNMLERRKYL